MTTIGAGGVSENEQGTYEFRSPSHPGEALRVIATSDVVEVRAIADDSSTRPYVRHPRCTLDALWNRLTRELWPRATSIHVDYQRGGWDVGEPGDRRVLKDLCPDD